MTAARRFPPPWTVEALEKYFIVRDAHEQALDSYGSGLDDSRVAFRLASPITEWPGRQRPGRL